MSDEAEIVAGDCASVFVGETEAEDSAPLLPAGRVEVDGYVGGRTGEGGGVAAVVPVEEESISSPAPAALFTSFPSNFSSFCCADAWVLVQVLPCSVRYNESCGRENGGKEKESTWLARQLPFSVVAELIARFWAACICADIRKRER